MDSGIQTILGLSTRSSYNINWACERQQQIPEEIILEPRLIPEGHHHQYRGNLNK